MCVTSALRIEQNGFHRGRNVPASTLKEMIMKTATTLKITSAAVLAASLLAFAGTASAAREYCVVPGVGSCPMAFFLPVGSSCTCNGPQGSFFGVVEVGY